MKHRPLKELLGSKAPVHFAQTFRLLEIDERQRAASEPWVWIRLEDWSGSMWARIAPPRWVGPPLPGYRGVLGQIQPLDSSRVLAQLTFAREPKPGELSQGPALWPHRLCPVIAREALRDLVAFHEGLPRALQRLVSSVLLDSDLDSQVLNARALSPHGEPGGRLVRSVASLGALQHASGAVMTAREREHFNVTLAGCVLYSLLRTPVRTQSGQRTAAERIAPALDPYTCRDPAGALWLRALMDDLDRDPGHAWQGGYPGAELVRASQTWAEGAPRTLPQYARWTLPCLDRAGPATSTPTTGSTP